MSINEILCQISTFLAAGHETSSSSLTWTLYALARSPAVQAKLREELRTLPSPHLHSHSHPTSPTSQLFQCHCQDFSCSSCSSLTDAIQHLPYLDAVVRESLRIYAPITTTMRVATADDIIPVAAPFVDRRGRTCNEIRVRKGDIISVPIQAMNKSANEWGPDADVFRPERWLEDRDSEKTDEGERGEKGERRRAIQGLWGNMLTFGGGNPVNGNRSCIGYKFALSE